MSGPSPCCPACVYDLTGVGGTCCPECGYQLSPEQLSNPSLLVPWPAWERRHRVGIVRGYFATLLDVTFRPGRFRRRLVGGRGVGAALFFCALLPLVTTIVAVCASVARSSDYYFRGDQWMHVGPLFVSHAIRCVAAFAAGWVVWLPTLAALDVALWRKRRAFDVTVKMVAYSFAWWVWPIAFMVGIGNRLLGKIDNDWVWGFTGGFSGDGAWPWICWLVAALTTLQFAWVLRHCGPASGSPAGAAPVPTRRTRLVLAGGWVFAVYLLLFDWVFHLRFHLQFIVEECWNSIKWMYT